MKSKTAEEIYREVHAKYGVHGGCPDKYDLEAMEAYASQSKWIPVEEPPNPEEWYLVCALDGIVLKMWYGLTNDKTNNWFYDDEVVKPYMQPTHWMNLPTPPTKTT